MDTGSVVTLDGSSSLDIDDGITAYLWTQISGPAVALLDPAYSQPSFTAPNVGPEGASLTFNLTVKHGRHAGYGLKHCQYQLAKRAAHRSGR